MGRLVRAIEKRASSLSGGSLENPANWMVRAFGLGGTAAGIDVSERNALYAIDVFTCVRIISETIGQLPFPVYKRREGHGKDLALNHPLYRVLHDQANPEMTSFTFQETLTAHLLTWGNGYAWIDENEDGDCQALWPLLPDRTRPFRQNGQLKYLSRIKKDPLPDTGEMRVFNASEVFHIPGLGFDGLVGYPVIQYLREQIGLAMAQEEYQSRLFSNGSVPPAVITTPRGLQPEDIARLQASWEESHKSVKRAWATAVLEEGMDIKTIGMPAQDAQFIEQRRFSSEKIAGFFRVPPHMIGDTSKATSYGTGIAQQEVGFAQYTIQPWATRWDQSVNMRLLGKPRDKYYYAKFDMDGIQRGDQKTRYDGYALGFGKWLTTDDIREREDMNRYEPPTDPEAEPGKVLLWPLNMAPAEKVAQGEVEPNAPGTGDPTLPSEPGSDGGATQAASRRALARAQRVAFVDVAERVLRREQADVLRAKPRERASFLESFYGEHAEFVSRQVGPQLRALAELVGLDVAREMRAVALVPGAFLDSYIGSYGRRHAQASLSELRSVPPEALEATFANWSARPAWLAARETVQAVNAFAKAAYRELGVRELVWIAGDECASCAALDGTRVAINAVFLRRGGGGPNHFIPSGGLGHPPLCDGCECVIVAGIVPAGASGHRSDEPPAPAPVAPVAM